MVLSGGSYVTTTDTPTGVWFVRPLWVQQFDATSSSFPYFPGTPQRKTFYEHDPARQGGTQYGNVTRAVEYAGSTAYRETFDRYYPRVTGGKWIVNRLGIRLIRDGSSYNQSKVKYIYDDPTRSYDVPPDRGDLVKEARTTTVGPTASYDVWQTTRVITYAGAISYYVPIEVADGNGNVTRTAYDATSRFPVAVTDALGHTPTRYEYDWALGQVLTVTTPNGAATATSYRYDQFGRLTQVIKPGDSESMPTVKVQYCDTCRPYSSTVSTIFQYSSGALGYTHLLRFYNGLGQLIQEDLAPTTYPREAPYTSELRVTNYRYNAQGLQERAYVPYTYATSGVAVYITPD